MITTTLWEVLILLINFGYTIQHSELPYDPGILFSSGYLIQQSLIPI
jgi:hypothetical protein